MSDLYSGWSLCADLKEKEVCVVLERYTEGVFVRIIHEHVRASRFSSDQRLNLLKALVIGATNRADDEILSIVPFYLNGRGATPAQRKFPIWIEYPEPGVLRTYCGTNTLAWSDQIIAPEHFRRDDVVPTETLAADARTIAAMREARAGKLNAFGSVTALMADLNAND